MIPPSLHQRLESELETRREKGLLRTLRVWPRDPDWINLADNDYLDLARDARLLAAAQEAARLYGCSSSASPLISGYQPPHQELEAELCRWHKFPSGLVWNSGYAANQAVLGRLPRPADIVFADRLIHNSMISGILQSGARLVRYRHNDFDHLRHLLKQESSTARIRFVVTESVFSMDGDSPDLAELIRLKEKTPFCLVVDEAHATGWYGPGGAGLVAEADAASGIDVLVGTCGKALGSQGAYTLFHDPILREYLVNHAGEFIYSTYLSPIAAATSLAAIEKTRELSVHQNEWRAVSRGFRSLLRADGWNVPDGDSPVVPVMAGESDQAVSLGDFLKENKILTGVIRPPTVPANSTRLRFSLKRSFTMETAERIRSLLHASRSRRK